MEYKDFLKKHETLTGNCIASQEQYKRAQENYSDAQANHEDVKERYDGASEEDRPKLQGEFDDSKTWLQTSANYLHESEGRRDNAVNELSQFEWANREFDDFRRSEAEKEPSIVDKIPSVDAQIDYAVQGAAIVGVAANLNVAAPDLSQSAQDHTTQTHSATHEMPAPPFGELKADPGPKDLLGDMEGDPWLPDPRDTSDKAQAAFKEHENYENALANAPSAAPPSPAEQTATYDVSNNAKSGDPTLSYNASVSLPPTPDQRFVADSKFAGPSQSPPGMPPTPDQQPAAAAAQPSLSPTFNEAAGRDM